MGFAAGADGAGSEVDSCGGTEAGDEMTELAEGEEGTLDGTALATADGAINSGASSGGTSGSGIVFTVVCILVLCPVKHCSRRAPKFRQSP